MEVKVLQYLRDYLNFSETRRCNDMYVGMIKKSFQGNKQLYNDGRSASGCSMPSSGECSVMRIANIPDHSP